MALSLGDKVSFINEKLDGVVTKVIDNKSVEVTTTDGFAIPVLIPELVKTGGAPENDQSKTATKQVASEDGNQNFIPQRANLERKVYLCFTKNDKDVTDLFILNNESQSQFFTLRIKKGEEWVLIYSGKVTKQSYVFVSSYNVPELDGFGNVNVQSLNMEFTQKDLSLPKSADLKIKQVKFFKASSFKEIPILEKNAMLVDVDLKGNKELLTAAALQASFVPPKEEMEVRKSPKLGVKVVGKIDLKGKKRQRSRDEIDLHVEQLNVPFEGKSNGEIVQLQIAAAKDFVDKSIIRGKNEIVVIHGVGNGVLKAEVQKLLKSYYAIKFEAADARKYGDGATLVHLKG